MDYQAAHPHCLEGIYWPLTPRLAPMAFVLTANVRRSHTLQLWTTPASFWRVSGVTHWQGDGSKYVGSHLALECAFTFICSVNLSSDLFMQMKDELVGFLFIYLLDWFLLLPYKFELVCYQDNVAFLHNFSLNGELYIF